MRRALIVVCVISVCAQTARTQSPPDYCATGLAQPVLLASRPGPAEPAIDDVNWFARPVPNPARHWIVAFASHNENYLYNLTTGQRIRIPDKSDAVATPDGRFMTVPSHYTSTATVNFYDASALLRKLAAGQDASTDAPVFAHRDADVAAVYYQSIGVIASETVGAETRVTYRMMFSGSRVEPRPGFRIVDYRAVISPTGTTFTSSRAMKLCPEIVDDMATPFISKDGRYVVAHDRRVSGGPGTLKIFEITAVDPAQQTTTCALRVDFGFAAGKADFSFNNDRVTFHISKHDYLTPFINGGLRSPAITDIVVADLRKDSSGGITGHGPLRRLTTTTTEGTGSYFPAFFPDGKVFYITSTAPRDATGPKQFLLRVADASAPRAMDGLFTDGRLKASATTIGNAWQQACSPAGQPFKGEEAAWPFLSLTRAQCQAVVTSHLASHEDREALMAACRAR